MHRRITIQTFVRSHIYVGIREIPRLFAFNHSKWSGPLRQTVTSYLHDTQHGTRRYATDAGVCSVNDLSAYMLLTSSSSSGKHVRVVQHTEICTRHLKDLRSKSRRWSRLPICFNIVRKFLGNNSKNIITRISIQMCIQSSIGRKCYVKENAECNSIIYRINNIRQIKYFSISKYQVFVIFPNTELIFFVKFFSCALKSEF